MKVSNQHVDMLLVSVVCVPKGAKEIKAVKGFVLERGEGVHTHILEDVEGVMLFEHNGDIYVRVEKSARINHEEHGIQTLKPGIYKKAIERVYDYETEETRNVID